MRNPFIESQFAAKRVYAMQLKLSTTNEIKNRYSIEITDHNINDDAGNPISSGVNSLCLGTSQFKHRCSTCLYEKSSCHGHNGFIKLNKPIIHPLAHEKLIKRMNEICISCKKLTQTKKNKCAICGNDKFHYIDD